MQHKQIFLFALFFLMMTPAALSQRYEVGIFGGGSYYSGDLNPGPEGQFRQTQPAFGGLVRYNFDKHLSLRLTGLHGTVQGTDEGSPFDILPAMDAYYRFETTITELSLQGEVNFLPYIKGHEETLLTPYIFGGIGYFMFDTNTGHGDGRHWHPEETSSDPGTDPEDFSPPDDFSDLSTSYLMGAGVKFHITEFIGGGFEWGLRYTSTDYIDQVGLRANPKQNDWYSFAGLTITFRFRDSTRAICPY